MSGPTLFGGDFEPQDWMSDGACRPENRPPWISAQEWTDMFFPERGESSAEAEEICSFCPVIEPCLAYALQNGEKFGIWGGLRTSARRRLGRWDAEIAAGTEKLLTEAAEPTTVQPIPLFFVAPTAPTGRQLPRRAQRGTAADNAQQTLF